jgi:nitrite reductase/ring-hydroxylating ferredoxin subunit
MEDNQTTNPFEQLNMLLESIEQHPEEAVRNHVRALVYTMLDLHHFALQRMVDIVGGKPMGEEILDEMANDEHVKAIFMAHDLMPKTLDVRVENALDKARQSLKAYDADVELVEVSKGVARLKLIAGASAANVSSSILKGEIEHVLRDETPDLLDVVYEDFIEPPPPQKMVQIQPRRVAPKEQDVKYLPLIRTDQVAENSLQKFALGDINVLLCNLSGTIYSFQNACPLGDASLESAAFTDGILTCECHGARFDIRHNGKSLDEGAQKLEALPMKVENGVVKVNLPAEV